MQRQARTNLAVWTGVSAVHGLLAWGLALQLAPTTGLVEPPAMQVELAEVLGGQIAPRQAATPPSPPPSAPVKAPPKELKDIPPVFRTASLEPPAPNEPAPAPPQPAPALTPAAAPQAVAQAPTPAPPAPRQGVARGLDVNAPHGAGRDYSSKLRSWLEAHKTYPRRSRMRREEGIVEVRFILDRRGHVLDGDIIRTSGFSALDAEVLAMLVRADPFPAAPQNVLGERIEIAAPVEFFLNR